MGLDKYSCPHCRADIWLRGSTEYGDKFECQSCHHIVAWVWADDLNDLGPKAWFAAKRVFWWLVFAAMAIVGIIWTFSVFSFTTVLLLILIIVAIGILRRLAH